jgi:hypothetical protein
VSTLAVHAVGGTDHHRGYYHDDGDDDDDGFRIREREREPAAHHVAK